MKKLFLSVIVLSFLLVSCTKMSDSTGTVANFSFLSSDLSAPSTVKFINSSTNATSYYWDFGDGSTSDFENPSHVYTTAGVYNIKLTATGSAGTDIARDHITISHPTELKVKVTDSTGTPLVGASATLFSSLSDYQNFTNPVATTSTDANGYMYFSSKTANISTVAYYYYISGGCKDNKHSTTHFTSPLVANALNIYNDIMLSGEGKITVTNNASSAYEMFIDGIVVNSSLNGGNNQTFSNITTGNHVVRVLQLNGYTTNPNDQSFNVTVTCGGISAITFP